MPSAPCFKMNAFWASENLDAFIALRPSQPGNRRGKLYLKTIQFCGLRAPPGIQTDRVQLGVIAY
jgi:hypothetical protein